MELDRTRILIAVGLFVIIVGVSIFAFVKKDSLFTNKVDIKYPDGCIETYVDGVAVSPICSNGRVLQDQQNRQKGVGVVPVPTNAPGGQEVKTIPQFNITGWKTQ